MIYVERFYKQLSRGAIRIELTADSEKLPLPEDGIALLREQLAELRKFVEGLESAIDNPIVTVGGKRAKSE